MEESITKAAGGEAGEYLPESEICALISGVGPHSGTTDNYLWPNLVRLASREPGRGAGWRSGSGAVSAGPVLAS